MPLASKSFPMELRHGAPSQQKLRHSAASLQTLRHSALASLSATAPPCQQQTSSGGEEYSGLASNLAHLGRIC